jgi:hypothetical protein
MNKTTIGILFMLTGWIYGSLAIEKINYLTIGYLLKNGWIKQPSQQKTNKELLGSKTQIIIFAFILNAVGIFILLNRNI